MYPPQTARDNPDKIAYLMTGSGASITYGELDATSNRLAHFWHDSGVAPGDSVVVAMENAITWPVVVAAGMRSGLYVTPINWHLKPAELAVLLDDAAPAVVVTSRAVAADVLKAIAETDRSPIVICADGDHPGCVSLDEAIADRPATPLEEELLGARVLYSSGTTGRPKRFAQKLLGVHPADAPRRHSDLVDRLQVDSDTVLLSPAPNYHAAPFTFALITLSAGGTVACMERFDARGALQAMVDYEVTHSQWVPTMLVRMLRLPDRAAIPLASSHRVAFTSGAPCPVHVKDDVIAWWGPILHEYYGASEGYGHTYVSPTEALSHPGTVGRPLGSTHVRIVDDSGASVPAGVDGTVCFEALEPAAYRNSDDTTPALKEMGDLGHLDEDGFLYLVGRRGFTIISGGVNIYPDEIESALLSHPAIADAAVIGIPDDEFGESVKAVVRLQPGSALTAQDVIDHARSQLAHFKAPRTVEFTDDLPRLPTGKLDKPAVIARFEKTGDTMPAAIDTSLEILHALKVKGLANDEILSALTGQTVDDLAPAVDALVEDGFAVRRDAGRLSGTMITPAGRDEYDRRVAALPPDPERDLAIDGFATVFGPINTEFKQVCSAWQVRPDGTQNDHTDSEYDAAVIADLVGVDEQIGNELAAVTATLPRLARYRPRLRAALERVRGGDHAAFARPMYDSYHDIWMELHQDLILTSGRERDAGDE